MIDIHAHVFNVRSLPVCGILKSRGMPTPIAALVAAALRVMAADEHSLRLEEATILTRRQNDPTAILVDSIIQTNAPAIQA